MIRQLLNFIGANILMFLLLEQLTNHFEITGAPRLLLYFFVGFFITGPVLSWMNVDGQAQTEEE